MGEQFTITLSDELAKVVHARLESGEYASVDQVVGEALWETVSAEEAHTDEEIEHWLRTEVMDRLARLKAHPETGVTPDEVRAMIDAQARRLGVRR